MLLRQQTCLIFQKKSLEWQGSNLRCKPTIILYTLRDKVLNSIELRTKKTSNLFKNSNVIKQIFFYFFVYKIDFLTVAVPEI